MKYIIVGGVAGGMSTAARIRRIDPKAEIKVFEKGPHVSFSNCCLPYHLSDIVPKEENLILMTPERLKKQYNLDVYVNHEVINICPEEKFVKVKNHLGEEEKEPYDVLVLSPGAKPIRPVSIFGVEQEHVFTVRNVVDIAKIKSFAQRSERKKAVVVGGGFIGIEVVENLQMAGFDVTLVERENQVMTVFDYDMAQILHKELLDKGVHLIVEDGVASIGEKEVILQSGKKVECDFVILAMGVEPDVEMAREAGIAIGQSGGIVVNRNYQTSKEDIYAVGDAIEVTHLLTREKTRLPLAGPAQKQARNLANHLFGKEISTKGVIGSSVVQCFSLNAARTGMTVRECQEVGYECDYVYLIPMDKVGLMPDKHPIHFKLVYSLSDGKILGAQAIGEGDVVKSVDTVATAIAFGATVSDLMNLELCYAPPFSTAKDVVNMAGIVANNLLQGSFRQVHVNEVRKLWEEGEEIIDVREPNEYQLSHIKGAKNIPLSEFRQRLEEFPKDHPIYIHCRSAQRSYFVVNELTRLGWKNVFNISGSYLGLSLYEYFNDMRLGRESIFTEYNFN